MSYLHRQMGTLVLVLMGAVGLFMLGITVAVEGPIRFVMIGFALLMGFLMALFGSLTVQIEGAELEARFGIGWIKKRFALRDIVGAEVVRNRWYYGWGIRLTPSGWMYNVSGLDAVELQLSNGRRFRIGTDEPQELCAAIRSNAGGNG